MTALTVFALVCVALLYFHYRLMRPRCHCGHYLEDHVGLLVEDAGAEGGFRDTGQRGSCLLCVCERARDARA